MRHPQVAAVFTTRIRCFIRGEKQLYKICANRAYLSLLLYLFFLPLYFHNVVHRVVTNSTHITTARDLTKLIS